jgi:glutamate--cysteine ligase catalytic subunit
MDIQLTDFENTSLIVLLGLITNVCNFLNVNFIMPISLVDENMKRAHYNDALLKTKFWFNLNCVDHNNIASDLTKHDSLKST